MVSEDFMGSHGLYWFNVEPERKLSVLRPAHNCEKEVMGFVDSILNLNVNGVERKPSGLLKNCETRRNIFCWCDNKLKRQWARTQSFSSLVNKRMSEPDQRTLQRKHGPQGYPKLKMRPNGLLRVHSKTNASRLKNKVRLTFRTD